LCRAGRHLVARLQAALDRQVDLDHLEHARGQLVALRELLALLSNARSNWWRFCSTDSLSDSSWPAAVSSASRTSNHW